MTKNVYQNSAEIFIFKEKKTIQQTPTPFSALKGLHKLSPFSLRTNINVHIRGKKSD